jgi:uncharacterized repeat protein (TIGR01451 family)
VNAGRHILIGVFLGLWASAAQAAPTPAATVISNIATLNYEVGGTPDTITSPPASFTVDELIDVSLTWQDASSVAVNSPDVDRPLAFILSNIGNGPESFSLSRNNSVTGDNFDPSNGTSGSIYLENGLQPGFQASGPNADTIYIPGTNDPNLTPGSAQTVYVDSNIPGTLTTGNTGLVGLTASSKTPGAAGATPGTSLAGQGVGGVDALVGSTSAQATRTGSYIVSGISVALAKTIASVVDPRGGSNLEPGSIVTYQIVVTVSGSGTAGNLTISDPLPAEFTYIPGSTTVGAASRTDAADADNASFGSGTVTVNFGSVVAPATLPAIQFRATLN